MHIYTCTPRVHHSQILTEQVWAKPGVFSCFESAIGDYGIWKHHSSAWVEKSLGYNCLNHKMSQNKQGPLRNSAVKSLFLEILKRTSDTSSSGCYTLPCGWWYSFFQSATLGTIHWGYKHVVTLKDSQLIYKLASIFKKTNTYPPLSYLNVSLILKIEQLKRSDKTQHGKLSLLELIQT